MDKGARTEDMETPQPRGWRLDEQTRRIGLQGVADARARLERAPRPDEGEHKDGRHHRPGRAA